MGVIRSSAGTAFVVPAAGTAGIGPDSTRLTLCISTDGLGRAIILSGTDAAGGRLIACLQQQAPTIVLDGKLWGAVIQGSITVQNNASVQQGITFTWTNYTGF